MHIFFCYLGRNKINRKNSLSFSVFFDYKENKIFHRQKKQTFLGVVIVVVCDSFFFLLFFRIEFFFVFFFRIQMTIVGCCWWWWWQSLYFFILFFLISCSRDEPIVLFHHHHPIHKQTYKSLIFFFWLDFRDFFFLFSSFTLSIVMFWKFLMDISLDLKKKISTEFLSVVYLFYFILFFFQKEKIK